MVRHRTQPTATPSAGPLSRRLEDYLEAIGDLVAARGAARVRDIAARTGVSMSTVTAALKQLAKAGLVQYDPYELVRLTAEGEAQAGRIRGKHDVLAGFLTGVLGIDAEGADRTACRMEHVVDEHVLGRMELLAEFIAAGGGIPHSGGPRTFAEFCRRRESVELRRPHGRARPARRDAARRKKK